MANKKMEYKKRSRNNKNNTNKGLEIDGETERAEVKKKK